MGRQWELLGVMETYPILICVYTYVTIHQAINVKSELKGHQPKYGSFLIPSTQSVPHQPTPQVKDKIKGVGWTLCLFICQKKERKKEGRKEEREKEEKEKETKPPLPGFKWNFVLKDSWRLHTIPFPYRDSMTLSSFHPDFSGHWQRHRGALLFHNHSQHVSFLEMPEGPLPPKGRGPPPIRDSRDHHIHPTLF